MKKIGEVIRAERKREGISQAELADRIGAHVNSIQNYENGRRVPTNEVLDKIEEVLAVSLRQLQFKPDSMGRDEWLAEYESIREKAFASSLAELAPQGSQEAKKAVEGLLKESARVVAAVIQLDRHGLMRRFGGFPKILEDGSVITRWVEES